MTITEVRKKVKKCKDLLSEYNTIYVTLRAVKRMDKEGIVKENEEYVSNMERRLLKIEEQFNTLLK